LEEEEDERKGKGLLTANYKNSFADPSSSQRANVTRDGVSDCKII